MYSGDLSRRDRAGPVMAVVLIHLALGAMLLGMAGNLAPAAFETALKTFDVRESPPPPIPPPPPKTNPKPSSAKPNAPAPPAKKAEATPIVAPKPAILLPVKPPLAAAPVPGQATAPSQGASTAGPGTGAGGVGSGTGGGGTGAGNGGDGGDGIASRPRPRFRPLDPRGFPRALVEPLANGARVLIIFTVQVSGRISDCIVRESSRSPPLDAMMCQVAINRFRYDPARRADGTPVVAKAAYLQQF